MPKNSVLSSSLEMSAWLALAAFFYALSFSFSEEKGSFAWGAASWPRGVIALIAIGAIFQFYLQLKATYLVQAYAPSPEATSNNTSTEPPVDYKRAVGVFLIPLVYLLALPRIGFYIATPVFLAGFIYYLGERRWGLMLSVTFFIYGLVNLVFTKLFYVALPTGTWPGFYDFSNWFVTAIR
ncbi:MAG: tripartite tricarboxylate transporter TctB family protein [Bordetella sp.]|jgi:hypothetical protein